MPEVDSVVKEWRKLVRLYSIGSTTDGFNFNLSPVILLTHTLRNTGTLRDFSLLMRCIYQLTSDTDWTKRTVALAISDVKMKICVCLHESLDSRVLNFFV